MKKASVLFLAATALFVASCTSSDDTTTTDEESGKEEVQEVTYSLDAGSASLEWHGEMNPEYGHDGTVAITEGSVTMMGEDLKTGSFKIDMNSITVTDESMEDDKKGYLAAHLKGTAPDEDHPQNMFWDTPNYPAATVTLNSFEDGQLDMTMNVIGKEVNKTVPATIKMDGDKMMIMGDFSIDFSDMGIPGFMTNPDTGEGISPNVDFSLNLTLSK